MSEPARDLLRQLSATSTQLEIKQERPSTQNGSDEIELGLGLSLNGSFGVDPSKKTKLIRSSSVACFTPAEIERPLVRMSSLPSEELQVLKRLEAKRKRLERRNSLNKNGGEKCEEELVPKRRKVEGESENLPNGLLTDRVDLNNGSISHGSSSSFEFAGVDAKQIKDKMAVLTNCTEKKSLNSSLQTSINDHLQPEHKRSSSISPSPRFLTGIQNPGKRIPGRAHSFSVVERNMLHEMPCVSTKGEGPTGKKVDGFLYKYNKGEEVRIVCVCHGRFLTPAEFVRHAGGGEVAHPLRHITVNASPSTFA